MREVLDSGRLGPAMSTLSGDDNYVSVGDDHCLIDINLALRKISTSPNIQSLFKMDMGYRMCGRQAEMSDEFHKKAEILLDLG